MLAVGQAADGLTELLGDRHLARGDARPLSRLAVTTREDDGAEPPALHSHDRQVDAVLDGQPVEEPRLLVGSREPELGPVARGSSGHVLAEELDTACRGRDVAADDVEERGLPGAVRAEDCAALAVHDVQIDVVHREEPAETPADPPQAEGRHSTWNR